MTSNSLCLQLPLNCYRILIKVNFEICTVAPNANSSTCAEDSNEPFHISLTLVRSVRRMQRSVCDKRSKTNVECMHRTRKKIKSLCKHELKAKSLSASAFIYLLRTKKFSVGYIRRKSSLPKIMNILYIYSITQGIFSVVTV